MSNIPPILPHNRNLRPCPDCGSIVSKKAKRCIHCGRKLPKSVGCIGWFFVIFVIFPIIFAVGLSIESVRNQKPEQSVTPKRKPLTATEIKRAIRGQIEISNSSMEKSDVTFEIIVTITNGSDYRIKDFEIECLHYAPSGTQIDSNTRTIYQSIEPHNAASFRQSMGFIHSQASKSTISIKDFQIAE
jgi:hypothetical protein